MTYLRAELLDAAGLMGGSTSRSSTSTFPRRSPNTTTRTAWKRSFANCRSSRTPTCVVKAASNSRGECSNTAGPTHHRPRKRVDPGTAHEPRSLPGEWLYREQPRLIRYRRAPVDVRAGHKPVSLVGRPGRGGHGHAGGGA